MRYEDVERLIRQRAREQPRGWQAELSRRLGISPASVAQKLGGTQPRRIPPEHIHTYLDLLGLELTVSPKAKD